MMTSAGVKQMTAALQEYDYEQSRDLELGQDRTVWMIGADSIQAGPQSAKSARHAAAG
jgi:hypothetical protein